MLLSAEFPFKSLVCTVYSSDEGIHNPMYLKYHREMHDMKLRLSNLKRVVGSKNARLNKD